MSEYYNRKSEEITMQEWSKLLGDREYKIVKQDELSNGKWVSTVWLGLNHSIDGEVLIFETMVFLKKSDMSELEMLRYKTEEEALKGHQVMVKKYSKITK